MFFYVFYLQINVFNIYGVKWLQCAMFVLVTSLCLAFSDDDLTFL